MVFREGSVWDSSAIRFLMKQAVEGEMAGYPDPHYLGFPGGSDGKEFTSMQETRVRFLDWEDPLEKGIATHSSILG